LAELAIADGKDGEMSETATAHGSKKRFVTFRMIIIEFGSVRLRKPLLANKTKMKIIECQWDVAP
jgi:hypothetical protein